MFYRLKLLFQAWHLESPRAVVLGFVAASVEQYGIGKSDVEGLSLRRERGVWLQLMLVIMAEGLSRGHALCHTLHYSLYAFVVQRSGRRLHGPLAELRQFQNLASTEHVSVLLTQRARIQALVHDCPV